jgi:hypothetical protein
MRRCPSCKLENDDAQYYCAYCGTVLLNDIEIGEIKKQISHVQLKKYGLTEFLKEFQSLFVIMGVFGALSFYLTSLFSSKGDYNIVLFANNSATNNSSLTTALSNSQFSEITGKISLINSSASNTPLISADPVILLQIAMFCSFLLFFLVLAIIIKEADKIDSISKWLIISIMDILFVTVAVYLLNTYAAVGLAVLFGIIFCLTMFGYFIAYKFILGKANSHPTVKKFLFLEPISWGVILGIIVLSLQYLNQLPRNSDFLIQFCQITAYFVLFGVFGGLILTIVVFNFGSLQAIVHEFPQFMDNSRKRKER